MKKIKIKKKAKIAIFYRSNTPIAKKSSQQLALWLLKHDYQPVTGPDQNPLKGIPQIQNTNQIKSIELVIVLGGDGTYLRANRLLNGLPIPILGVNLGSLGFLTPLKQNQLYLALPHILRGENFELVPRMQMNVSLYLDKSAKTPLFTALSLNDVVIERGQSSHLIDLQLNVNKKNLNNKITQVSSIVSSIKADGLVIATPTGSTAYNLAAGGPILNPETPCIVASSVAPHSLTNRPLIFPDTQVLEIQLQRQCEIAHLVIDGQKCSELIKGQVLRVSKHHQPHWMVQSSGHNFYELLREKLSFGERA